MNGPILVTGASGPLGRQIVDALSARVPPDRVAALCRDPSRVPDLVARGVDVRIGDYRDPGALARAFRGVETLMLVSAPAFTDALTAHHNVIVAARDAKVSHFYFASIQRRPNSSFAIAQVTDWNAAAEAEIASSGMDFTILRNTLYVDALDALIGAPGPDGVLALPAGHARAALATRADIAEATAAIIADGGYGGRSLDLAGSHPVSMDDVAGVIAEASGQPVSYRSVSVQEFVAARVRGGQDRATAAFHADWLAAIAAGEFAATGVIEEVLRRPPTDPLSFVRDRRTEF